MWKWLTQAKRLAALDHAITALRTDLADIKADQRILADRLQFLEDAAAQGRGQLDRLEQNITELGDTRSVAEEELRRSLAPLSEAQDAAARAIEALDRRIAEHAETAADRRQDETRRIERLEARLLLHEEETERRSNALLHRLRH
jgi:chromosome segregation ATPase